MRRALTSASLALVASIGVAAVAVQAQAAPVSAPAKPTAALVYTVKPGDYLLGIANKLHVTLDDLLAANSLTKKSVIHPGDQLVVPPGGVLPGTPPTTEILYTVKAGDYLLAIATKMHVTLDDLLAVNGLTKKSVIRPGDRLVVPPGGVLPATPPSGAPPTTTPPTTGVLYTVKPGDYFKRIAQQLGVTMDALLAVNNMKKTTVIHTGMQLQIPVGGVLPPGGTETSAKVKTVLDFASAQLGEPYKANGAGPNAWDCSGLTMRAFASIGISLPHYSGSQAKYGQAVDWKVTPIRAGDLVFLSSNGVISHVGIATGPTTWIQSPEPGGVVRTGSIPFRRVVAVRRLVNGG